MAYNMSITIRELAQLAGVSPSTVSRSLNDSPLIPAETRDRIRRIAAERGFAFNANARSLILGRTGTVALIFPDYFESAAVSPFFTTLLRLIREKLEEKNIDALVAFPFNRFAGASNVEKLVRGRKVDGMIIIDNAFAAGDRECLERAGIPYLFLHKSPDESAAPDADRYCTDHVAGGRLAAERLTGIGRRRLLVARVAGEEFDARTEGFLAGAKAAGIAETEIDVISGDLTFAHGYSVVGRRVASSWGDRNARRYDGVFCQTDLLALGAVSALRDAGFRVPEDVSVVGYDDIELGRDYHPALTTIRQPLAELVARACDRMTSLIERKNGTGKSGDAGPVRYMARPELVVRES